MSLTRLHQTWLTPPEFAGADHEQPKQNREPLGQSRVHRYRWVDRLERGFGVHDDGFVGGIVSGCRLLAGVCYRPGLMRLIVATILLLACWLGGPARAAEIDFGRYHALVIGNNDYKHLPRLETAVSDAAAVAEAERRKILGR